MWASPTLLPVGAPRQGPWRYCPRDCLLGPHRAHWLTSIKLLQLSPQLIPVQSHKLVCFREKVIIPHGPTGHASVMDYKVTEKTQRPSGPCRQQLGACAWQGGLCAERCSRCCHPSGTLISHDKLLLQINPERELGNMSYKLGQVSPICPHGRALVLFPRVLLSVLRLSPLTHPEEKLPAFFLLIFFFVIRIQDILYPQAWTAQF